MNRILALLSFAIILSLAPLPLSAQNQGEAPRPQRQRVGPPPENATAAELERQGDELRANKAFKDALDYYHAAIAKAPSASLWNKIGIAEFQLGHDKEAGKAFDRAIKLDRTFAEPYNNRGALHYIRGAQKQERAHRGSKDLPRGARNEYRKAIKEYAKAVELSDATATYHSNLGTAYFGLRDFAAAATEYWRALQLDPNVFERRAQTGVAAQISSPEDRAHYSFVLARMYARFGDLDRALVYLRRAMEDGYKEVDAVYKDQDFAALRKDPRFTALMNRKPEAIPQ